MFPKLPAHRHREYQCHPLLTTTRRTVQLSVVLFLFIITQVNARGYSQPTVSLSKTNVTLTTIFRDIEKQSDYHFFFNESLLEKASKVTIHVQNVTVQDALDACFKNQEFLTYAIVQKSIIIKKKEQPVVVETPTETSATNIHVLPLVRGVVKDEQGPVAGATISIRGTKQMTTTNSGGEFTLEAVSENAVIIITSVSHEEQQIRLAGRGVLSVTLKEKVNSLDEQVVVAYSNTTQRRATGAFTVVKGEDVQSLPNRSVDKSLQGFVPGLLVTSGTGQPGGGLSNFVLRGIATADNGLGGSVARNPLIVVDGVPVTQEHTQWNVLATSAEAPITNPMAQLNPSDIESITVLKDAAAIALYGSKASNGVILITTKRGKNGKTIIGFRHQTDLSSALNGRSKLLNQQEYLELLYESYRNLKSPKYPDDAAILEDLRTKFPTRSDKSFYPEANWKDAIYAKNATTISNELSVSGGNERSNFYLNIEWTKQNGVVKKTGYDRKSIRFNFENRPVNWFKLGLNSSLSYNVQDYASIGNFPIGMASMMSPLHPIYLEDGSYLLNFAVPSQGANPLAEREYNVRKNIGYRGLSKLFGELTFLKYFKLSSAVGVDFLLAEAKERTDPRLYDAQTRGSGSGRIQERDTRNANIINTNTLSFDKRIKRDHTINLLIAQEAQILSRRYLEGTASNLSFSTFDQINNGGTKSALGLSSKQTLLSYFGQLNYGYKNKYFLTGSARQDGSSKFGERQRFGTYWSGGIGWVITEESFMKISSHWIDYLKLRGSIGASGNSGAIDRFTRYDILQTANYLNSSNPAVYPGTTPGNPDIQWEQTFTWDAGLEVRLWKQRLHLSADVYNRKTSDLIYNTNLAPITGYISFLDNIGNMRNTGVELSLSATLLKNRNWDWNFAANWSTNKNRLLKANVPLASLGGNILGNAEGRNFNSFYLVRWAGVNPDNGAAQWRDSLGKNNVVFDAAKREFVGKPQPDGFGSITNSLSFKNFQLSVMLYYQYGFQIYNNNALDNDGSFPYINQEKSALNRWRKPGDQATHPKRILDNFDYDFPSTRFLIDGDFIRLQNVSLSYALPSKITNALHISMARIYAQGYNLALWTKFKGNNDPNNITVQGGAGAATYPDQRSYSLGINVNF